MNNDKYLIEKAYASINAKMMYEATNNSPIYFYISENEDDDFTLIQIGKSSIFKRVFASSTWDEVLKSFQPKIQTIEDIQVAYIETRNGTQIAGRSENMSSIVKYMTNSLSQDVGHEVALQKVKASITSPVKIFFTEIKKQDDGKYKVLKCNPGTGSISVEEGVFTQETANKKFKVTFSNDMGISHDRDYIILAVGETNPWYTLIPTINNWDKAAITSFLLQILGLKK